MSPLLRRYLNLLDHFLAHCRTHLTPEQWQTLTERLTLTPLEHGYSLEEPPTPYERVWHYWRKLDDWQQAAFLREQRDVHRAQEKEVRPCS